LEPRRTVHLHDRNYIILVVLAVFEDGIEQYIQTISKLGSGKITDVTAEMKSQQLIKREQGRRALSSVNDITFGLEAKLAWVVAILVFIWGIKK
jgi:hypothetical protein